MTGIGIVRAFVVSAVALAGCKASLRDCQVECAGDGSCPRGFACNAADNFCYRGGDDSIPCADRPADGGVDDLLNDAVDILFVIDNSNSMSDEQAALAAAIPTFIANLEQAAGAAPSLHIGFVSTDVGVGEPGFGISDCSELGDNGLLQTTGDGTCPDVEGNFLEDVPLHDGERRTNYPEGMLATTFSCMARLGVLGCGFEQPLEAIRRALDGRNPENAGFRRPGAALAIVLLGDEDDCSVFDGNLFDPDATAELGPLSSYRCFEFGVVCEPDERDTVGARQRCQVRDPSMFVETPATYADFVKTIVRADHLVVAGIFGPDTPVGVVLDPSSQPDVEPSCDNEVNTAKPGIRLQAFLDEFDDRSYVASICDTDLSEPLADIAARIADALP